MAYGSLQQTIWAARLDANLQKNLVYASLTNKNYEQDALGANIVAINTLGTVNVYNYTGTGSNIVDDLSSTSQSLSLNQKKYFSTVIHDFVKNQSNVQLADAFGMEAAYAVGDTIDQYVAALSSSLTDITTQVTASTAQNKAGTITHIQTLGTHAQYASASNPASHSVQSMLAEMGGILDEKKVPRSGRWAVLPAWANALLVQDLNLQYVPAVLANGLVQGQSIAGFQIFVSQNVPGTDKVDNTIMAGHPVAWTFAMQLQTLESFPSQQFFGDIVRGLYVYGGLVTKNTGIAFMHAARK